MGMNNTHDQLVNRQVHYNPIVAAGFYETDLPDTS